MDLNPRVICMNAQIIFFKLVVYYFTYNKIGAHEYAKGFHSMGALSEAVGVPRGA
jgi:hypothetical protein